MPHPKSTFFLSPADAFTELADTYDARLSGNPVLLGESGAVMAMLPDLTPANRVADVGCGTGRYAFSWPASARRR